MLILGSQSVPDGTPAKLRSSVTSTTTISRAEETSGIVTNQLDELVIRPTFVGLVSDGKKPALDRNAATKHTPKTKMQK